MKYLSTFLFIVTFLLVFTSQTQAQNRRREETGLERSVRITNNFLSRIGNDHYRCDDDGHDIDRHNYRDHFDRYHARGTRGNRYAETGRLSLEAFLNYLLQRKQLNIAEKEIKLQYESRNQAQTAVSSSGQSFNLGEASTLPVAEYFADPANFKSDANFFGVNIYTKDSDELKLITTINIGGTWKRVAKAYKSVIFKGLINTGSDEKEVDLKTTSKGSFKYTIAP